jgi:hypothetical protein
MKEPYLEITYRRGRPIAAYLYLPRSSRDRSFRTAKAAGGLVIDFARSGKAIGIEITAPSKATATGINRVLKELGFPPIKQADLAPLRAA